MEIPKKVGDPIVLGKKYGKTLIAQSFTNPLTGGIDEYSIFQVSSIPYIVMPITKERQVVVIRQFRHGINEVVTEFPGGNPKSGETPEETALNELEEETGFQSSKIIRLGNPRSFEPSAYSVKYQPFLALDCMPTGVQKLDTTEFIEVFLISLNEWFSRILSDPSIDSKTIAITFLALSHLGISFNIPISEHTTEEAK